MNFKRKVLIIGSSLTVFAIFLLVFKDIMLTKNHPVKSNILVIEGWLSPTNIEYLYQHKCFEHIDTVYVTGIKQEFNRTKFEISQFPINMYTNGVIHINNNYNDIFEIFAHGTKAFNKFPTLVVSEEFKIIGKLDINDSLKKFSFKTNNKNIYLSYINDAMSKDEDRNLYLDSVKINNKLIHEALFQPEYSINIEKQSAIPFSSNAQKTAYYLSSLNVKCHIMAIDTFYQKRNRTLATAMKLASAIKAPVSMNIVSVHDHSRRSYLAYKSAFPRTEIGIISIDDRKYRKKASTARKLYQTADEYVSILVTSLICLYSTPLK